MLESLKNVPLLNLLEVLPSALRRGIETHSLGRDELVLADTMATKALLQIRAQLNLLSPMARLPSEILAQCFDHVMSCALPGHGDTIGKRDTHQFSFRPLITIIHVCKRWREVALGTPALWTYIDDERPTRLEAFLARSQHAPISMHLTTKDLSRTTLVLNAHASRMRRLDLTIHDNAPFIPPLLQFKAPLLECLTICSELNSPPPSEDFTMLLFRERELDIRALALVGLNPWLPGNRFPQLTHLYLSKLPDQFRVEDNIAHFRQLLFNTPALQYLHVGRFGYGISITDVGYTIPLPALRGLTFTDSMFLPTLGLFAMLDLPQDVMVRLDRLECVSASRSVPHFPIPSHEFLSSLHVIEVVAMRNGLHLVAQGPRSGLWIRARCIEDQWDGWLSQLTTFMPMPSVKEVRVAVAHGSGTVIDLLRQLPHLTKLAVFPGEELSSVERPEDIFQGLYHGLAQANPILAPRLEVLEIHSPEFPAGKMTATAFVAMARARHALGCPLHTVDCNVAYDDENEDHKLTEAAFLTAEPYVVKHLDLKSRIDPPCSVMDERWRDPGAERWWTLPDGEQANF